MTGEQGALGTRGGTLWFQPTQATAEPWAEGTWARASMAPDTDSLGNPSRHRNADLTPQHPHTKPKGQEEKEETELHKTHTVSCVTGTGHSPEWSEEDKPPPGSPGEGVEDRKQTSRPLPRGDGEAFGK